MGEGGVEGENCFQEVPPHSDPLPQRGEGNKRIVLSHKGARGEKGLSSPTKGRGEQKDNPLLRRGEGIK